jgi:hypothetical protein
MIGIVVLLSLASVGSLVAGNMYLEKQAKKLNELKVEDELLEEQQTALTQANKDIAKYTELEKISKSVVPQDKDQAKAVLEIIQIAKESKISIRSITFPTSNLGSKAAPQSNSNSSSGDTKTSTPATSPISQAKPVEGIPGVYSLEMSIVPESDDAHPISYYQFLDFLNRLENNRRTAQVTQIKVSPRSSDKQSPFVTFTLTINIFVKP